jgi:response regulator NasT
MLLPNSINRAAPSAADWLRRKEKNPFVPGAEVKANRRTFAKLKGARVVIAEDQGLTQLHLRKILNAEGLDVVGVASNGKEALDLVLQHKPEIVLMDVRMPIMDGLEASRLILEKYHVCIVILTAFSEEDYRREAMELGVSNYVLKPVSSDTLIPQIATALERFNRH